MAAGVYISACSPLLLTPYRPDRMTPQQAARRHAVPTMGRPQRDTRVQDGTALLSVRGARLCYAVLPRSPLPLLTGAMVSPWTGRRSRHFPAGSPRRAEHCQRCPSHGHPRCPDQVVTLEPTRNSIPRRSGACHIPAFLARAASGWPSGERVVRLRQLPGVVARAAGRSLSSARHVVRYSMILVRSSHVLHAVWFTTGRPRQLLR